MASRFKRRPRVVWLPNETAFQLGTTHSASTIVQAVGPGAIGLEGVNAIPLVFDQPFQGSAGTSLADIESSGYRLRRVVGKIYASVEQIEQADGGAVLATAGLIVLRVDDNGVATNTSISPQGIQNVSDPWIWRRTWILANGSSTNVNTQFIDSSPFSNYEGGPAAVDGPHLDQKTARIVSTEERLHLVISTTLLHTGDAAAVSTQWLWDFRVLGSMRSSSGNRRNAVR